MKCRAKRARTAAGAGSHLENKDFSNNSSKANLQVTRHTRDSLKRNSWFSPRSPRKTCLQNTQNKGELCRVGQPLKGAEPAEWLWVISFYPCDTEVNEPGTLWALSQCGSLPPSPLEINSSRWYFFLCCFLNGVTMPKIHWAHIHYSFDKHFLGTYSLRTHRCPTWCSCHLERQWHRDLECITIDQKVTRSPWEDVVQQPPWGWFQKEKKKLQVALCWKDKQAGILQFHADI